MEEGGREGRDGGRETEERKRVEGGREKKESESEINDRKSPQKNVSLLF